jgi:hypothetical protein
MKQRLSLEEMQEARERIVYWKLDDRYLQHFNNEIQKAMAIKE